MKKITILTLITVVILTTNSIFAQWTAVNNGLPAGTTKGLAVINGKLFTAVKGHGIYVSSNNGDTWSKWSRSGELPNTNFISFTGSDFDMSGQNSVYFIATGENLMAVFEDQESNKNLLSILPTNGLTSTSLQINTFGGSDAGDKRFYATNGGLYVGTKSPIATFTKVEGIAETKINTMQQGGDDGEFIFLGTDKGVFRSSDDGLTFTAYNLGFEKIVRINRMSGLFTLTERGVYNFNNKTGSFSEITQTGSNRTQNVGDYKTSIYYGSQVYFFGNNIGSQLSFITGAMSDFSLDGITNAQDINGSTAAADYLFVSTEFKGIFRIKVANLGIGNFNQLPKAEFTALPNPSNGNFKIISDKATSIQLFDLAGKLIKTYKVDGIADIKENLTPGIYLLKDSFNGATKKLIVK